MPVILSQDDYDLWLDPGMTNVDAISDLLKPFDAKFMRAYPVSSRITKCRTIMRNALDQFRLNSYRRDTCSHNRLNSY